MASKQIPEEPFFLLPLACQARMFDEFLSRDHEDGRATGSPQGVGPKAYLNGTSQDPTPEDAREDGHIQSLSKRFIKHPGLTS